MHGALKSIPLVLLVLFFGVTQATDTAPVKDDVTAMLDAIKLLKERDAQLVMAINKDLSMDLINLSTGERLEGCSLDSRGNLIADNSKGKKCYPVEQNSYDNSLKSGSIEVREGYNAEAREGAICIYVIQGPYRFTFCDPPYDLGF